MAKFLPKLRAMGGYALGRQVFLARCVLFAEHRDECTADVNTDTLLHSHAFNWQTVAAASVVRKDAHKMTAIPAATVSLPNGTAWVGEGASHCLLVGRVRLDNKES